MAKRDIERDRDRERERERESKNKQDDTSELRDSERTATATRRAGANSRRVMKKCVMFSWTTQNGVLGGFAGKLRMLPNWACADCDFRLLFLLHSGCLQDRHQAKKVGTRMVFLLPRNAGCPGCHVGFAIFATQGSAHLFAKTNMCLKGTQYPCMYLS